MSREHEEHLSTADIAAAADSQQQAMERRPDAPPMPRNEMDGGEQLAPLFDGKLAQDMRTRWSDIQSGFVDDPRQAVQRADELVAQALQDLARSFAKHREQIDADAKAGGDTQGSTENLRVALRRYRSFFERLLSL